MKPISNTELAIALLEFFSKEEHGKAFQDFLFERYDRFAGVVTWSADTSTPKHKRVIVQVTEEGQSGGTCHEDYHAIKVRPMKHEG